MQTKPREIWLSGPDGLELKGIFRDKKTGAPSSKIGCSDFELVAEKGYTRINFTVEFLDGDKTTISAKPTGTANIDAGTYNIQLRYKNANGLQVVSPMGILIIKRGLFK